MGTPLITTLNEARHRARFRAWTLFLDAQLRRRDARLVLDAPHGARMHGFPLVDVEALGEGGGTTTLRVGRGVELGAHLHLDLWAGGTNTLELDDGVFVGHGVRLQLRNGRIAIGEHTHVRDGVMMKSEGELTVGREVTVSYRGAFHCVERITMADHAQTAENVSILDSDHVLDGSDTPFLEQPLKVDPVEIGRNAFVAAGAVVLRGARIGPNAVIGAGSVVSRGDYEAGWLYAGQPARPVRALTPPAAAGSRPR